ncbi:hypothetical protein AB0B31_30720 [Catellatospora citrea]|uniref:hypothetical protein n=1 Tax=Catellatospora citrea TaxID=53366 RepID=UPI0033FA2BB3
MTTLSAIRLRSLAVWSLPFLALGVGLRVAVGPVLSEAHRLGSFVGFVVFLLLPVPLTLALVASLRRLTAGADGFDAVPGAFRVRTDPALQAAFLYFGYLTGMSIIAGDLLGLLAVVAPMIGIAFVPQFVLTPTRLELPWSGIPVMPWDQLMAVEVVPVGRRASRRALRFTLSGPGRRPRTETLPLGRAQDGTFLARALQHYAAHPEHRAAIGTEAELRRLREVLAAEAVSPKAPAGSPPSDASPSPEPGRSNG